MGLKSTIGGFLRDKLGVSELKHQLQQRLHFSQAMLQLSVPEVIIPDEAALKYSREEISKRYGIEGFDPAIHKNDLMFQHHFRKRVSDPAAALFHYYNVGLASLEGIKANVKDRQVLSVLDFGSGYGRGSRFLPFFFPEAKVSVSEVKSGALDFQQKQFGYNTLQHSEAAKSFNGEKYDLIIAISVFSHLPKEAFKAWITVLMAALTENGLLFFTYHPLEEDKDVGYLFIDQSEDSGLDWVSDRIQQRDAYGSSFYSERKMKSILSQNSLDYDILPSFSGAQTGVLISK